jgi:hypothetical protein
VPQAQAAQQRLKHASAPPIYGHVTNSSKVRRHVLRSSAHLPSAFFVLRKCRVAEAMARSRILRRYIAACYVLLFSFFSCCDSAASPQATAFCANGAGNIYHAFLLICRVLFSCCDTAESPQGTFWAPAWASRSRTCDRSYIKRHHFVEGTSPRDLLCLCADEAGNIYSFSLLICRVVGS